MMQCLSFVLLRTLLLSLSFALASVVTAQTPMSATPAPAAPASQPSAVGQNSGPGLIRSPAAHPPGARPNGPDPVMADPLAQLRDIHGAPPPPWWPPAPGWWVVAAFALLLLYFLLAWLRARLQRRQQRLWILQRFSDTLNAFDQHGDRRRFAMEMDVLLRRLALRCFAADQAGLTGSAWLQLWGAAADDPVGRLLLQAPYQAQPSFDPAQLHAWVMDKVRRHA